jgi:phosphoribosyl 1,2-cyclic phosphodiesterase
VDAARVVDHIGGRVRVWTLGSGSAGNAIVIEADGTRVLIDAGYPARTLARRMESVELAPESIDALIVTHEHVDHCRGVSAAQNKWGWPVFASAGTLAGIPAYDATRATAVAPGTTVEIGALSVTLIAVSHDAAEPTALTIEGRNSGTRAGVAHDLGIVPETLRAAFIELDVLLLESNHDVEMLRNGPYPPFLQQRIASRTGHLSNFQSASLLRDVASERLQQVILLHLSEENNSPHLAQAAANAALKGTRCRCSPVAAPQGEAMGPFGRAAAPSQLSLF